MGLPTTQCIPCVRCIYLMYFLCNPYLSGTRLAMLLPGKSRQAAKGTWGVESAWLQLCSQGDIGQLDSGMYIYILIYIIDYTLIALSLFDGPVAPKATLSCCTLNQFEPYRCTPEWALSRFSDGHQLQAKSGIDFNPAVVGTAQGTLRWQLASQSQCEDKWQTCDSTCELWDVIGIPQQAVRCQGVNTHAILALLPGSICRPAGLDHAGRGCRGQVRRQPQVARGTQWSWRSRPILLQLASHAENAGINGINVTVT